MTRKTLNIIIGIVISFIVLFYAGTNAYEQYLIEKNDQQYEESLKDLDNTSKEHESGQTNHESKN